MMPWGLSCKWDIYIQFLNPGTVHHVEEGAQRSQGPQAEESCCDILSFRRHMCCTHVFGVSVVTNTTSSHFKILTRRRKGFWHFILIWVALLVDGYWWRIFPLCVIAPFNPMPMYVWVALTRLSCLEKQAKKKNLKRRYLGVGHRRE